MNAVDKLYLDISKHFGITEKELIARLVKGERLVDTFYRETQKSC